MQSLCGLDETRHVSTSAVNSDVTVGEILQGEFKKTLAFSLFGQQVSVDMWQAHKFEAHMHIDFFFVHLLKCYILNFWGGAFVYFLGYDCAFRLA